MWHRSVSHSKPCDSGEDSRGVWAPKLCPAIGRCRRWILPMAPKSAPAATTYACHYVCLSPPLPVTAAACHHHYLPPPLPVTTASQSASSLPPLFPASFF